MKAIFCYDGPFYKDENGIYYGRSLNDQMFERYFMVADSLEIVIRARDISEKEATESMSKITNSKISITECPNLSSVKGMLTKTNKVYRLLEERIASADIVFIRLPSNIGNIAVDVCKKLKKKYLLEVVGCPWDAYWNYSLQGKFLAPIAKNAMRKRVKNAPYVLYVTNNFLQNRYPTEGESIGCSNVELAPMSDAILEKRLEKISNYREDTKYIIGTAAGIDILFKGQQYVIQALGILKKMGITNIEYQLIGGGSGEYLRSVAKENGVIDQVNIIGQLPHNKVFDWLDKLDIYVQPSRQEGLPRSMIEAMSRGLPCIGANTAGIPELIDKKYVFSNSNIEVEEIYQLLMQLLEQPDNMKIIAERNYNEAKKYQRNILIERRTKFFKEFVES